MTVYLASKMAAGIQPRYLATGAGVKVYSFLALAALVLNDTINMLNLEGNPVHVGNGPTVEDMTLACDKIDTGNVAILDVGDATVSGRYITGSNVGQAGGVARLNNAVGVGYQPFVNAYTNPDTLSNQLYTVVVKCTTAPNAFQAGTIRLVAEFTYNP